MLVGLQQCDDVFTQPLPLSQQCWWMGQFAPGVIRVRVEVASASEETGFVSVSANTSAFAALKHDGSIRVWGDSGFGGADAPAGLG